MANPEHLKILKQGVKAWNKWRKENPDIKPDLSRAFLAEVVLDEVDLHESKLRESNLARAFLLKAELTRADLSSANLSFTMLAGAILKKAKLNSTDMVGANLARAILEGANLKDAELIGSCLFRSDLTGAILTGVKLYGTSRDDWIIRNIECQYVYWDNAGKRRSPKDRDLEPGEFERLYAALPTIEYIFENGMTPIDPLIMDRVVQAIREKRPEFDIKIDSINARGLSPSIKFTVQHEDHKEPALEEVRKEYEIKIGQLKAERDRYWEAIQRALDKPREVKLITSPIYIENFVNNALELQKAIADEPEGSKSFATVAKKTALDIIGEVMKDIAKGQVKEAAKQIIELGKDLGPIIAKTAAYAFFKSLL